MKHSNQGNIYKVFSNKHRVQLIVCLSQPKSVSELLELCHLSQSALSQHLLILKEEGVASCVRDGKKQIYSITNKKVLQLAKSLLELEK